MPDKDGYPTEEELNQIRDWSIEDFSGMMRFIKELWAYTDWGWHESNEADWLRKERVNRVYRISTAGWSGNEDIISAMQENTMVWFLNWWQSRRGGHYVFIPYYLEVK